MTADLEGELVTDPYCSPLTRYEPLPPDADLSALRAELALVRHAAYPDVSEGNVGALARLLVAAWGIPEPAGALVHTARPLDWHVDKRLFLEPRRRPVALAAQNLTLWLRSPDSTGGELMFPDEGIALACADGWAVRFDGQRLHGVTAYTGTRIALTYWLPRS